MLNINIPNNNIEERKYIINELVGTRLGLNYVINVLDDIYNYELCLTNNTKLIIVDSFFSNYPSELSYLDELKIPDRVTFVVNDYIVEQNIPVIYGIDSIDNISVYKQECNSLVCNIDIFASSFFMLTRWEEYVIKDRDIHLRFLAKNSLAFKNGFLHRPVVNEYTEMLWNMLYSLDTSLNRIDKQYSVKVTHDVDDVFFWKRISQIPRYFLADLIKRKSVKLAFSRLKEGLYVMFYNKIDVFNTFDYIMNISDQNKVKSCFYFMTGGESNYDNRYKIDNPKVLDLISNIIRKKHIIGFHPSYNTYNSKNLFRNELDKLKKNKISFKYEGRQHCLRFQVPFTWRILEENDIELDSSMYYAEAGGYRCGVCNEFSVFDIIERKKLRLKELPLTIMDVTILNYLDLTSSKDILAYVSTFVAQIKKYNGSFVLLWHNSNFIFNGKDYKDCYEEIIKLINE